MNNKKIFAILIVIVIAGLVFIYAKQGMFTKENNETDYGVEESDTVEGTQGYGVSASHPLAAKAGMEVLENGGNAADAAVAVSYVLGVVEPFGSGIGGGGEMLVYPQDDESPTVYQYRETAPLSEAEPETFAIPGMVKGMEAINEDHGTMEMEELIQPAIDIAEEGFQADKHLVNRLKKGSYRMDPPNMPNFFPEGGVLEINDVLKQPELAESLKTIQQEGADGFYVGDIAEQILEHEPEITPEDLSSYAVETTEPVHGKFAGYDVYSAPPPLAGVTLIQSLQMADMLDFESVEDEPENYIHLLSEITKKTYADRIDQVGDPKFTEGETPLDEVLSQDYAKEMADTISLDEISESGEINDSISDEEDHDNTTHFVIIDEEGTMISATHTLGNFFGSGDFVGGFFMNNQMENFSQSASSLNNIEPGKTPRSFTSPTILTNGEKTIGIGSPGGKRIPMVMTQVLIKHLIYGEPLDEAVKDGRIYVEDNNIFTEYELDTETQSRLRAMGYEIIQKDDVDYYGGIQSLVIDNEEEQIYGVADERRGGIPIIDRND